MPERALKFNYLFSVDGFGDGARHGDTVLAVAAKHVTRWNPGAPARDVALNLPSHVHEKRRGIVPATSAEDKSDHGGDQNAGHGSSTGGYGSGNRTNPRIARQRHA